MYTNLVLSGGALRGVGLLGAIKYLEELDYIKYIKNYIGTSAGAIICFFIILGYNSNEIIDIIIKEINTMVDLDFENIPNFLDDYGIDDCKKNKEVFTKYLKLKTDLEDITFIDFTKKFGLNLIITGSNLTTHNLDYFNVDNTPNMSIINALLITSCLPLIYKPIQYNECIYIDGGIYNNFAIDYFEKNKNETLGINVNSYFSRKNNNFVDYFNNIIYSIMDKLTYDNLNNNKNYNIYNIYFDKNMEDDIKFSLTDLKIEINIDKINYNFDYGYNDFKKKFKIDF